MKRKAQNPWERMPKESDPAWEAFVMYRDMPEETGLKRSCRRVAQRLLKSDTIIRRWSSQWNWQERVAAYDNYRDELEIAEKLKAEQKRIEQESRMDERHVALSLQLQKLLLDAIKNTDIANTSPKMLDELSKAVTNAVNLERTSRHATHADQQLKLNREMFEYKKERDAGANIEYENLDDAEDSIYGESESDE